MWFILPFPTYVPVPHTLQKMVLSSGSGPRLNLPLVLEFPLQLKLAVSRVALSQVLKKEFFAVSCGPYPLGPSTRASLPGGFAR